MEEGVSSQQGQWPCCILLQKSPGVICLTLGLFSAGAWRVLLIAHAVIALPSQKNHALGNLMKAVLLADIH
ncbi:MAG TPA: hypothetical protein GYA08_10595 [Chloroflexi bacterium]|nr:hypothetical protein [Chloroflexota bacterium]